MEQWASALEELVIDRAFWSGRRVFLTGHTGFKGSWVSLWLKELGAEVYGYALEPPTNPSLFEAAQIGRELDGHVVGDVRDDKSLGEAMRSARPEIILHLAAQPLVRYSYAEPVETFAVNVMGTVNVHEAARRLGIVDTFVNVTTDKCYDNKETQRSYGEDDPLGGRDPYSSSKACSEHVTAAYRSAFHSDGRPWVASARAGNVIGGGDWATDRLLPDVFRALDAGEVLTVRQPEAVRPWQHVLEPLSGYLLLAERLATGGLPFAKAWNFGPEDEDAGTVRSILARIQAICPELRWEIDKQGGVHEAKFLRLDSGRSHAELGWARRWPIETALEKTVEWHRAWRAGEDMGAICRQQIAEYEAADAND